MIELDENLKAKYTIGIDFAIPEKDILKSKLVMESLVSKMIKSEEYNSFMMNRYVWESVGIRTETKTVLEDTEDGVKVVMSVSPNQEDVERYRQILKNKLDKDSNVDK